ncbi:hypothetical protein [Rhizobium azibense]|uniref:hypothetical protein n=1 Tax=Rhizobium azibense TaxID=1136135 RepID=UPI001404F66B|nr:hypothetical protein [Rhizobium azibense]
MLYPLTSLSLGLQEIFAAKPHELNAKALSARVFDESIRAQDVDDDAATETMTEGFAEFLTNPGIGAERAE